MLLERDRIRIRLGHALHHLDALDVELVPARRALVGANFTGDNDGRLLREPLERFEDLRRDTFHVRDSLNGSSSVAKDRKQQLPTLAQVIEPSAQRD